MSRREHPYRARPQAATHEWLTPPDIVRAVGPFDLDPCAAVNQPWQTAIDQWTDGGLDWPWVGNVWCNPPYGRETEKWLRRCAEHGNAIALVFARTETRMFFDYVWETAAALLFLRGRPHFHRPDGTRASGNSGGPLVLIGYGRKMADRLSVCGLPGAFVMLGNGRGWG